MSKRNIRFKTRTIPKFTLILETESGDRYICEGNWQYFEKLDSRGLGYNYARMTIDDNEGWRLHLRGPIQELRQEEYDWEKEDQERLEKIRKEEERDRLGRSAPTRKQISSNLRWKIWERDNFTCQICGVRRNLTIDHIVPVNAGGTDDPDNLQTLCASCNSKKGTRSPEEVAREFIA